jgi:hypothetical protein
MQRSTSQAESDTVAVQLRDLERQGGGMAHLAHLCAGLLLAAFSLGSLISISQAAFYRFLGQWNSGTFDLPDAISLAVNVLLVLAADVGLLYAASQLRTLIAASAPISEQRIHRWAMLGASALESASYLYLVWSFDRPSTLFLWGIGITRALAAPLFAAYLSMARPIPVGPRDVAYQAALASGKGVVHDVAVLAADPSAPLERKVQIFRAASTMTVHDRAKFDGIIEAVRLDGTGTNTLALPAPASLALPAALQDAQQAPLVPPRPPTGPGAPAAATARSSRSERQEATTILTLGPDRRPARRAAARGSNPRRVRTATVERQVRATWHPEMTVGQLQRTAGISRSAAGKWRKVLQAEAEREGQAAQ